MRRSLSYSIVLVICCVFVGCASSGGRGAPELERDPRIIAALVERYGALPPGRDRDYLDAIFQRLSRALTIVGRSCSECSLLVLATDEPLAFTPARGSIVISTGLVRRLGTEAELAFILSHEIGHTVLEHSPVATSEDAAAEIERTADDFGVGLMALAGYDPTYATSALLHANAIVSRERLIEYPLVFDRVGSLEAEIERSGWRPPGTIDRREYQKVRQRL